MAIDLATRGTPTAGSFSRLYTGAWGVLAAIAASYLGVLAVRPDMVAGLTPPAFRAQAEPNGRAGGAQIVSAEVQGLRESVALLQRDLEHTRTALASEREQAQGLRTQLAAIEERSQKLQAVAETRAAPKLTAAQKAAEARAVAMRTAAPAAAVAPAAGQPASVQPPVASAIETASIGALPQVVNSKGGSGFEPTITTARPAAPSAPVALQLGGGPSIDALRLSWSLLSERHGTVLRSLSPRYTGGGTDESPYQLIAGPVATAAEAQRLCSALKARRIACSVSDYKGDAL